MKGRRWEKGKEEGAGKESQMCFTNQRIAARERLLDHSIVYVHFARACVRKHMRMTAQRVYVHGFKNCAPPSLLSGRGKQTPISARRSKEKAK